MYTKETELYHYGIQGMKWGVRRYQNYDGSYTQAGVQRYNKASSNYESAKSNLKTTKENYKSGTATKNEVKTAKKETKAAKKDVKKQYSKLKTDKAADQGKELYKQGKTISGNNTKTNLISLAGYGTAVASGTVAMNSANDWVKAGATGVMVGALAGSTINLGKNYLDNKKLRAYYAH